MVPYHAYVPAFGDWGFVLASNLDVEWNRVVLQVPVRFLKPELLPDLTTFDPDSTKVPTDVSTLENPAVWRYYLEGWQRWRG